MNQNPVALVSTLGPLLNVFKLFEFYSIWARIRHIEKVQAEAIVFLTATWHKACRRGSQKLEADQTACRAPLGPCSLLPFAASLVVNKPQNRFPAFKARAAKWSRVALFGWLENTASDVKINWKLPLIRLGLCLTLPRVYLLGLELDSIEFMELALSRKTVVVSHKRFGLVLANPGRK